ncbi:MAG: type I restriction endonuclease subunit R [Verrucomicrobiales bacterium]|nr:type I restriction endonuclease subunit R [Verrucomicrobiales bacterium]MBP9222295.1 type I restriction endonuclease subunit R [Verrucomicrobiales bacterium]
MPERPDSQTPALALLRDVLGYSATTGAELTKERGTLSDPWLESRLLAAVKRVNPGLGEGAARQAILTLRQTAGPDLLEANERLHVLLSRWVSVEEPASVPGQPPMRRSVRFFDFETVSNNEFLVTEEFVVKGPQRERRFDLVIHVNGLPLVVIECKDPADPHAIEKGVGDLLAYQRAETGAPRLFETIHFCLALNRHDARYGTVATELRHYARWKSLRPFTEESLTSALGRTPTPQDETLASLCEPAQLLDFLRGFVAYERRGGRLVKKLARYQQWEAVIDADDRVSDRGRGPLKQRGGVIWHTQGSGKSLTMLWLALRLRRSPELENPGLVIVTDRSDLDRQIATTFRNCGFENPVTAASVRHLGQLLDNAEGQTLLTTIQKFEEDLTRKGLHRIKVPMHRGGKIIVLIDEAHRTEYGVFNARLREAMPDACFIAFTGTPIAKTLAKFGSYIHRYTMPVSVQDGATVPILYENRLPDLAVWGKRLDPIFDAELVHLTEEQRELVKKKEATMRRIAEAEDRIEMIAHDIAKHYRENFMADGFKGQVAACSQKAAARYYEALDRLLPGKVALLISDPPKGDDALWELKRKFANESAIIEQFLNDPPDRLALIVVAEKYLTGFDAPVERVLYLDKPLREHNLLQAIARVNRPLPELGKEWGLVVDYWGVSGFLDQALEGLHEDVDPGEILVERLGEEAYARLRACHNDLADCFPKGLSRKVIEPWLEAIEADDRRAIFLARYRDFYHSIEQLLPDPRALDFLPDLAWYRRVRKEAESAFQERDLSIPDCSARIRQLIDRHVRGEEIIPLLKPIDILGEDFSVEIEKLRSPRAKAMRMEHAIRHTISVKLHEDPVFFESLCERLARIIGERKASRLDDIAEFRLLGELAREMRQRDQEAGRQGVKTEELPFFHAIQKALEKPKEGVAEDTEPDLPKLTREILADLQEIAVIDWETKEEVMRDMRRAIKRRLRLDYTIPADAIEPLVGSLMELAKVHLRR